MPTDEYIYNLKWKFPDLLLSFIKDWGRSEVQEALKVDNDLLLKYLCAEEFPDNHTLSLFCHRFRLNFSTLKTWNVLHLTN